MSNALIRLEQVAVTFAGQTVLDNIELSVEPGQIVTLIDSTCCGLDLGGPEVDFSPGSPLKQGDEQLSELRPFGRFASNRLKWHLLVKSV